MTFTPGLKQRLRKLEHRTGVDVNRTESIELIDKVVEARLIQRYELEALRRFESMCACGVWGIAADAVDHHRAIAASCSEYLSDLDRQCAAAGITKNEIESASAR